MSARVVTLLLFLSSAQLVHADSTETQIDEVMPFLSELARLGGYGVLPHERAAFVVRHPDGSIGCVLWPFTGQFQRTVIRTVIPPGTIVIAHTHPRSAPAASMHDLEEAKRLGLPIIVVGRSTLQWIDAEGRIATRRSRVSWDEHRDRTHRCSAAEPEDS